MLLTFNDFSFSRISLTSFLLIDDQSLRPILVDQSFRRSVAALKSVPMSSSSEVSSSELLVHSCLEYDDSAFSLLLLVSSSLKVCSEKDD
jgi:hypothetical protein